MKQLPIRILGIAPYDGMQIALERVAEAYPDVIVDTFTGDLEDGAAIVQEYHHEAYDCIISRGGTARLIRKITDIPVVEVKISVYDIMRTLKLAENYTSRFAIVGYPNITETAHTLCNLMKYQVEIITVQTSEEIPGALEQLQREGVEMILADVAPHRIAQEMGMNALLITSGIESLQTGLEQAISIGVSFQKLRQENFFLTSIMRGETESITVLDESGALYYSTPTELPPEMLTVLRTRIPEIPLHSAFRFYHNQYGKLFRIVAQIIRIGTSKYYLFHHTSAPSPVRSGKNGLRIYSKSECEIIFRGSFFNLSGALGEVKNKLDTLAATTRPLIILGEIGTGKIQIAHYVYLRSQLSTNPFVLIDCAVVSDKTWDNLLNRYDSPLNDSKNTICFQNFDAISAPNGRALIEMILSTQMALRERLIFCYNQPAGAALSEICEQLLRSLSCLSIAPLPLRNRKDEISSLASLYLGKLNEELGKQIAGFDSGAMDQLRNFNWPGNFIQFKRVIQELAIETDSLYIRSASVAEILSQERNQLLPVFPTQNRSETAMTLDQIIRQAIEQALRDNGGNQSAAAKQLGIGRSTLWRHLNSSDAAAKPERKP
ncbi:MAG: PrpR N-terminal domain-containing protein [Faecousia sp.]